MSCVLDRWRQQSNFDLLIKTFLNCRFDLDYGSFRGECPAPLPGVFLFAPSNPEVGEEKGEKRELGPVDPLEEKGEEKGEKRELGPVDPLEEKGKEAGTSIAKTPADSDGESQTGGQFRTGPGTGRLTDYLEIKG